jgi:hypothetical protein
MAQDSDEFIKNEIFNNVGQPGNSHLRIFQQTSNFDHNDISEGGLTFSVGNLMYGSCDAMWFNDSSFYYSGTQQYLNFKPIIALEGTDCLSRGSNGNAQYQRFHHALGAVKNGVIGIYYLKEGNSSVSADLYYMAYKASKIEKGTYLILQDLKVVKEILEADQDPDLQNHIIHRELNNMIKLWNIKFHSQYKNNWDIYAKKRNLVIYNDSIIKITGRNYRNFTDSSQRAGHIAVGEMYLTKYFFPDKKLYYTFPRMSLEEKNNLDSNSNSKEWNLLRKEENVEIICRDEIVNLDNKYINNLIDISTVPLKGFPLRLWNSIKKELINEFREKRINIQVNY